MEAVQIAKVLGATVIVSAGSERKRQICLDYGASLVVDWQEEGWPQRVVELCQQHRTGNGKRGVDVTSDPVVSGGQSVHVFELKFAGYD